MGRSDFDTINNEWFDDYISWLRIKKGQNKNTTGSYIKVIKVIMREAFDRGISSNIEYQKKYFRKPKQETDSIYLSEEEIIMWSEKDLSGFDHLKQERDRFLIQYYFVMRFGDTLMINESNFYKEGKKTYLKYRSGKTNTDTIVPVNKEALSILEKYNYKMPAITNQQANGDLKEIGRIVGITETITVGNLTRPKYFFITTHTARRSGATNLYLQGVPDKVIMDLGGWKTLDTFRSYIRLSKLESAKKASEFQFFK